MTLQIAGWRRCALLFVCGALSTLTLPPFFMAPLAIPSFSILYLFLQQASSPKRAFFDGWWWGMGFYVSGLYWFCIALLTDPEKFAWLIPFALFGLNAIIALYPALACLLFKKTKMAGLAGAFVFSVVWVSVEYVRGHILSGFPWNLAGYMFAATDASMQLASWVGVYGLTWVTILLAVMPVCLVDGVTRRPRAWIVNIALYSALCISVGLGYGRIADVKDETVPNVLIRLVQGNINQTQKWDASQRMQGVYEHVRLTQLPGHEHVTHVVWPETAVPYALQSEDALSKVLGYSMPKNAILITGALRIAGKNDNDWEMFNNIIALDQNGTIVGHYDKNRLVPFGEFLPLRFLIPDALHLPVGEKDFSQGTPGVTLSIPSAEHAMLPLICYEVIFPEMAREDSASVSPKWILNITNDAWFGNSIGPYQHFHMARMRAAENGLPLIRSANTGISAVIDAYGRVRASMALETKGTLDAELPISLPETLYRQFGDRPLFVLIFVSFLLIIYQRSRGFL